LQRKYIDKEEATSLTVLTEAIMTTAAIEAVKTGRLIYPMLLYRLRLKAEMRGL
jgi:hypothetical protein